METRLTDHRSPVPRRRSSRHWLAAAGAALIAACLIPPLAALGRRYLFAESIQFCVFAIAAPALVARGAPWRLLPRAAARPEPRPGRATRPGLAHRLAEARRSRASFTAALGYLIAWVAVCLFWRLPPVLDGLARHPALIGPEAVTLCAAGSGLWLELVPSWPLAPRRTRPERALLSALAMWSLWVIAYVLGFASHSVVHAYDHAGRHLGTVADQELTAFLLWAAAAVAFAPLVFATLLTWLRDGAESAGEAAGRSPGAGVRGWAPPVRDRRRTSAR